jgi:hypothetical protein
LLAGAINPERERQVLVVVGELLLVQKIEPDFTKTIKALEIEKSKATI